MSDPREGEVWSVKHLLGEGVIRDAYVEGIVEGQLRLSLEGRQDVSPTEPDVLFRFVGGLSQHRCPISQFHRLYVRRVAFAAELRRIGRDIRRLAGGDVHLNQLATELDGQADLLTVGL